MIEEDKLVIEFKVDGKLVGKGRPRFAKIGNFVKTYSSQQDISYENWVKTCFKKVVGEDFTPLNGALRVQIVAHFLIPKSTTKKNHEGMVLGNIKPTKKPDVDNIAKTICDALNKIAYNDDSQIVALNVSKVYSEVENCVVRIEETKWH